MPRSLLVGEIPYANVGRTLRMAKLHMDATRSGSLFAERIVLVEGVTDAVVLRQLGAAWAGNDLEKEGFVDALTITVIGTKVGNWCVDLVATPGHEIVQQVAILRDSDTRGAPPPELPAWITDRDPIVKAFVSHPTLEPSLVAGNEEAVQAALTAMGIALATITPETVDTAFNKPATFTPVGRSDLCCPFLCPFAIAPSGRVDQLTVRSRTEEPVVRVGCRGEQRQPPVVTGEGTLPGRRPLLTLRHVAACRPHHAYPGSCHESSVGSQ
jgi:hypothetical protein